MHRLTSARRLILAVAGAAALPLALSPSAWATEGWHGKQALTQDDCSYEWNAEWGSGIGYAPSSDYMTFGGYTQSGQVDNMKTCTHFTATNFNTIGWALYDQKHNLYTHDYAYGDTIARDSQGMYPSSSGAWTLEASSTWGMHLKCATYYWYSNMESERDIDVEQPGLLGTSPTSTGSTADLPALINSTQDAVSSPAATLGTVSTSIDLSDPAVTFRLTPTVPSPSPGIDTNTSDDKGLASEIVGQETGDALNATSGDAVFYNWMNAVHPAGESLHSSE